MLADIHIQLVAQILKKRKSGSMDLAERDSVPVFLKEKVDAAHRRSVPVSPLIFRKKSVAEFLTKHAVKFFCFLVVSLVDGL